MIGESKIKEILRPEQMAYLERLHNDHAKLFIRDAVETKIRDVAGDEYEWGPDEDSVGSGQ